MKRIAIPTLNGKLSSHFGGSEYFSVYDIDDNKILSEKLWPVPEHTPGAYPRYLAEQQVTDVILGGVGQQAIVLFQQNNINVITGAPSVDPKSLVLQLIEGNLLAGDNSCDSDHHGHEHTGEHHHGHGHHSH